MLLGAAVLTTNVAVLKWLTNSYHVGQILFCRSIFISLPLAFLTWKAGGLKSLRSVKAASAANWKVHSTRGAAQQLHNKNACLNTTSQKRVVRDQSKQCLFARTGNNPTTAIWW